MEDIRLGEIMNLNNYKSGVLKQQYKYKSFSPFSINHSFTWDDPEINTMLEEATRELGKLDAFTLIVPNIDLFIKMHVVKEASTSSRIEGTKTEFDEALQSISQIEPERRDDWQEVQNYIKAMNFGIESLKTEKLPLCNRLLRDIHEILLTGARGDRKQPGEFRHSQNWIGGANLRTAYFIPPHNEEVLDLMSDLEKFIHNEEIFVPHLIRVAIIHYQFETIHPFLDGNGRIGRLLITLYFIDKGLLQYPSLYISQFLEQHKQEYYDALMAVRTQSNLTHWIKFFLQAIISSAQNGTEKFEQVLQLKNLMEQKVVGFGKRAGNAQILLRALYQHPIVTVADASKILTSTTPTARTLLTDFVKQGILIEIQGQQLGKSYAFWKYIEIYKEE